MNAILLRAIKGFSLKISSIISDWFLNCICSKLKKAYIELKKRIFIFVSGRGQNYVAKFIKRKIH
jgi:site-specific recombinase